MVEISLIAVEKSREQNLCEFKKEVKVRKQNGLPLETEDIN